MIKNYFGVPIYHGKLINGRKHADFLKSCAEEIKKEVEDMSDVPWNCNVWTTYTYDNQLFKRPAFHSVSKDITETVRNYAFNRQFKQSVDEIVIQHMFMNIQSKYQYQEYHDHRECLISGVFYIDVPDGDNMELIFKTPLKANYDDLFFNQDNVQEVIKVKPESGDIILFPSWIDHGVRAHLEDVERINIAFNFSTKTMRTVLQDG